MNARPNNVRLALNTDITHEDPTLLNRLYMFAANHPDTEFDVTSGDRRKQPVSSYSGVEAPEGASNHELYAYGKAPYDEALDVFAGNEPIGTAFGNELQLYGIHTSVPNDPIHLTLVSVNG